MQKKNIYYSHTKNTCGARFIVCSPAPPSPFAHLQIQISFDIYLSIYLSIYTPIDVY